MTHHHQARTRTDAAESTGSEELLRTTVPTQITGPARSGSPRVRLRPRYHNRLTRSASVVACVTMLLFGAGHPAVGSPESYVEQPDATEMDATESAAAGSEAAEEDTDELEKLRQERKSDDAGPSTLEEQEVPDDVDAVEAEEAVEGSDELTTDDVRYAAALEDLAATTESDFYAEPDALPDQAGTLIRQQEGTFYLDPVRLIEHDASVTTVMYRTTDSNDAARAAVANVLEPTRGADNSEAPVIVQAPGTQGMGDQCAPSRQMAAGTEYEGIGVAAALEAGYTVVMPDYIGLGTEGTHTYMNRVDQGHAVLDAARAAQQAEGVDITTESPIHIRGYSQGGGAAAAALELASEHAPELNLTSGAAGAAPADLTGVAAQIDSGLYNAFLLFALGGILESEGLDAADFLNAEGQARLAEAEEQCTVSALVSHMFVDTSALTVDGSNFTELIGQEPLASALSDQVIGQGRAPEVPVQINHSMLDDVIPYSTGRSLAQRWCAAGSQVTFESNLGPTHLGGYAAGMPGVALFTSLTFSEVDPATSCWRL